jgi:hypothetical protein
MHRLAAVAVAAAMAVTAKDGMLGGGPAKLYMARL